MSSPAFAPTVVPYLAYRSPRHSGNEGRPISSCYYSGSGTGRNPYRKASIAKRYPYWWVAPAIKPIEEVRSHTPPFRYRLTIRDDISRSASRPPERSRSSLPAKESTAAPSPPHFFRPHCAVNEVIEDNTDKANIGIRIKSNGNIGTSCRSCLRIKNVPITNRRRTCKAIILQFS